MAIDYKSLGLPKKAVSVAASQTTANISTPGDAVVGRDYLEKVVVTSASSAAPGAVTVFDGSQSLLVHTLPSAFTGSLVYVYELGVTAQTTKGFNITTGTSVSCIAVGNF
jgi:hypothetical protein